MWALLRQKILEKIAALSTTIQEAHIADVSTFEGFPALIVAPSSSESDYATTGPNASDKMTFAFELMVLQPVADLGQVEAENRVTAAVDEIISIFTAENDLDGSCLFVEPVNSSWGYQDRQEGQYRVGIIKIKCVVYVQ